MPAASHTFLTLKFLGGLALTAAVAAAAAFAGSASAAAAAKDNELLITTGGGTWEAAQRKAYFEPFEKATGIHIVLIPEDHAKLLASVSMGKPEADLTSVNAGELAGFVRRDAVTPIDYKYFDADTLANMADHLKSKYGVGAVVFSIVMAYNTVEYPASKKRPANWREFFDTKRFPGPRSMAGCAKIVEGGDLEFASLAAGADPKHLYPIDVDKAFEKLAELKPDIGKWWTSGGEAPQNLVSGEVSMSTAYNGRVFAARKAGAPIDFTNYQSLVQNDFWIVMKNSPNVDNAMKFLGFISKPTPQSVFSNEIGYGPINQKAYALIKPEIAKSLPGAPGNADSQLVQDYGWWSAADAAGQTNWDKAVKRCTALLSQ
ncbi:MAG TPA: ABC transporter substrate-binding protein [Steroidobacteraceae bacterium]|jgi:putative spermidine/putrescine transport system substrate-binding protein|nr:ABC transporter substrate-binding protein [Steroidobacteraceae bacterium]